MFTLPFHDFCAAVLLGHSAHAGYTVILDRNCNPVRYSGIGVDFFFFFLIIMAYLGCTIGTRVWDRHGWAPCSSQSCNTKCVFANNRSVAEQTEMSKKHYCEDCAVFPCNSTAYHCLPSLMWKWRWYSNPPIFLQLIWEAAQTQRAALLWDCAVVGKVIAQLSAKSLQDQSRPLLSKFEQLNIVSFKA